MLFIRPEEYINCGADEPICPVDAIFEEDEVPTKWKNYTKKTYEQFDLIQIEK